MCLRSLVLTVKQVVALSLKLLILFDVKRWNRETIGTFINSL